MKRVAIESPFAGDVEENIRYARECMRDCIMRDEAPIASHLLYTQPGILDDENAEERKLGMACGFLWGEKAEITVVYTDHGITPGMDAGIEQAYRSRRPVEYRKLYTNEIADDRDTGTTAQWQ